MTVALSHLLNAWGRELGRAFPTAIGVLHVGSSFGREVGWRDVDVRIVLTDEDYDRYQPLDHDVLAAAQAAVREHELERRHIREEQIR